MSIQISSSLICMTSYFFPSFLHSALPWSSASLCFHISERTICVYTCDTAIHETVLYLGDLCSPLASALHSVPLRNLFLLTVATVILLLWLMCLCHKTVRYRYSLEKTEHILLCCLLPNSGRISCVHKQHSADNKVQTTKASQTCEYEIEKQVCFLQREEPKRPSMSQSHYVYLTQSITEQRKYLFYFLRILFNLHN